MATEKILLSAEVVNNLLKTLPTPPKVLRNSSFLVPREMVAHLRRTAIGSTLPLLGNIVTKVKARQEKYGDLCLKEVESRQRFAVEKLSLLKHAMENDLDRMKFDQIRSLLHEIEHYKQIGTRPCKKIHVGKEVTPRIFKLLSGMDFDADPYIQEYLKRKIEFHCNFPSDIEISTLRAMLRLLRGLRSGTVQE